MSKRKAREVMEALDTLTSEYAQNYLPYMDPMVLRPEQYERLGTLYNRLRPSDQPSTPDPASNAVNNMSSADDHAPTFEDTSTAPDPSASRADLQPPSRTEVSPRANKRGRPSKKPREGPPTNDSWKGVKDLDEVILEPELKKLIEDSKAKPSSELATFIFSLYSQQRSPLVAKGDNTKEVLAGLCIDLTKKTSPTMMNNLCWLFEALAVGDMFVAVFGKACINRIRRPVKRAVQDAVPQDSRSENFPRDVLDGLIIATNVYFICELLGTGSLFFLRPKLNKNFLKNLVTKQGEIYNEMVAHFSDRGFLKQMKESGASNVGDAVRAYFRVSLKLDKPEPVGSDPTTTTAIPTTATPITAATPTTAVTPTSTHDPTTAATPTSTHDPTIAATPTSTYD